MKYRDMEHRLLARSVVIPEGEQHAGCWMWMGRVEPNGYGKITVRTKPAPATPKALWVHRLAYEVFTGERIPEKHHIDHRCRFRLCINPNHHECVPASENTHNRVSKYRRADGRFT